MTSRPWKCDIPPIRKCLTCGKDISHKDARAKFCSNKGDGNCKDAYHNANNPRGLGIKQQEEDYWNVQSDRQEQNDRLYP